MRAHVIENGTVVNTIEVDSLDQFPNLVSADVGGIGWKLIDGVLTPPDNPVTVFVPSSVTMRQARLALLAAGQLDAINTVIASITPPEMQQKVAIEWEFAQTVDRNSEWVEGLRPALGLTVEQLDDLFIAASKL